MSKARTAKAEDFLSKMGMLDEPEETVAPQPVVAVTTKTAAPKTAAAPKPRPVRPIANIETTATKAPPSRVKLKHIGAYLEQADCEKIALLRARLDIGNSQLFALAINALWKSESAKRKFGDA